MCLELPGELTCRPITLQDLGKDNFTLRRMYAFARTIDDEAARQDFEDVLRMASDQICNTCHEMGIDPMILDYWDGKSDIIVTPFEPNPVDD